MAGISTPAIPSSGGSVGSNVTVTNFPATQPVSGSVTANQGTSPWVTNISQWGGVSTSLGQKAMASSVPVVIASDQASFPVTIAAGVAVIGHVITDTGSVTNATLSAETTKVIGTARIIGNGGATLDSTIGAGTAPANQVVVGAIYNSTEISPTTGQAFALQADS